MKANILQISKIRERRKRRKSYRAIQFQKEIQEIMGKTKARNLPLTDTTRPI